MCISAHARVRSCVPVSLPFYSSSWCSLLFSLLAILCLSIDRNMLTKRVVAFYSLSLSLGHSVLVNWVEMVWVEMGFVDWVLRWIMFGWVEIGFVCARQTVENARYKALGINP